MPMMPLQKFNKSEGSKCFGNNDQTPSWTIRKTPELPQDVNDVSKHPQKLKEKYLQLLSSLTSLQGRVWGPRKKLKNTSENWRIISPATNHQHPQNTLMKTYQFI